MNTLNFYLFVFGIAYTLGQSKLTLGIRTFLAKRGKLVIFFVEGLECPACSSFHYAWILTLLGASPFSPTLKGIVMSAFTCTGASFLLGRLSGLIADPQKE